MTNHITNVRNELKRMMEDIPGLRAIDHMPDTWSDFPVAVITLTQAHDGLTLSGTEMEGEFTVTLLNGGTNPLDALTDLEPLIVEIRAVIDETLQPQGRTHYLHLARVDGIGMRKLGQSQCAAADLHVKFIAG